MFTAEWDARTIRSRTDNVPSFSSAAQSNSCRYVTECSLAAKLSNYVCTLDNPLLDAWFGARKAASEFKDNFVTKAEYLECGAEYIKEHRLSNW